MYFYSRLLLILAVIASAWMVFGFSSFQPVFIGYELDQLLDLKLRVFSLLEDLKAVCLFVNIIFIAYAIPLKVNGLISKIELIIFMFVVLFLSAVLLIT